MKKIYQTFDDAISAKQNVPTHDKADKEGFAYGLFVVPSNEDERTELINDYRAFPPFNYLEDETSLEYSSEGFVLMHIWSDGANVLFEEVQ